MRMILNRLQSAFCFSLAIIFIASCNKSVDPHNQLLDLSQITQTGTSGPGDFIGTIDRSDWSPSSYNTVVFGSSFWLQKSSQNDTLSFGGQHAGDSSIQSLKVYSWGTSSLLIRMQLTTSAFFTTLDSITIPPAVLRTIDVSFVLPDTTDALHSSTLIMATSTHDTLALHLTGRRVRSDTGGVVVTIPRTFSFFPAFPNPTDGEIKFEFAVPQNLSGVLKVVNENNEILGIINQGNYLAGLHVVLWNSTLPNGNYRVILQAGSYVSQGDIQVLR